MVTKERPGPRRNTSYDVIVVGARVGGAATALLLARAGLRTLLVDAEEPGADTLSVHALGRGGILQLTRWGVLGGVVAAGTPPVRRTTFRYGDQDVVVSLRASTGVDALYAPRRTVLDPLLVKAAADAGADVCRRTEVVDVIVRNRRVVGVRANGADGCAREIEAPLVIGADGARSTIAARTGATVSRTGAHQAAMTYAYWPGLESNGYVWMFRSGLCCGFVPTNDGETCVVVGASPRRIGAGGAGTVVAIADEVAPDLAAALRATPPSRPARTWSGRRGFIRRAWGPGWALVGDAGLFTDPIGLHGLTDALRDAELLALAVVDGFTRRSSLDEALASYETRRDRIAMPLFDVIDRIASMQWDDAGIEQLQQRLSSAVADEVEALVALGAREPDGRHAERGAHERGAAR